MRTNAQRSMNWETRSSKGEEESSKQGLLLAAALSEQYIVSQARLNDQAAPLLLYISGRAAGPSARGPARSQSAGFRNTETCRRSLYLHSRYCFSKADCAAGRLRFCSSRGLAEFKLQGVACMLKRHKNRSEDAYSVLNTGYMKISS